MSGETGRIRRELRRRGLIPRPKILRAFSRILHSLPTQGNEVTLFHEGDAFYERLFSDLRNARSRIEVEMYMILGDRVGWRFAHALAAKAKEGVPVRLVYDSVGSLGTPERLFDVMREAGAEVAEFNPVRPWRARFALFRRNHRKNIIIDGRIAYTGGINIGAPWIHRRRGGDAWRDSAARVEGPAAGDMEVLFAETWFKETGHNLIHERDTPREASGDGGPVDPGQVYVAAGRGGPRRIIRRMYLMSIGRSRRSISVTCSYFVPDRKLRKALYTACARGVRVRLLLPDRTDVRIAQLAGQAIFDKLLSCGIEIYLWKPTILHAKTAVVDDDWATIGTANLDNFSFLLNLETNLVAVGGTMGVELAEQFEKDLASTRRLTLAEWRRRPRIPRLLERLAWSVRGFL